MRAAVIVYPGSNCDRDCKVAAETSINAKVDMVWHKETQLSDDLDLIILPGGFSYGDYLRCGAMAVQSPINAEIMRHAAKGTPILGICNGFQVLCEAGLLPGTLLRNNSLKYICKDVELVVTNQDTIFTRAFAGKPNPIMTVGNGEGNYFADQETLNKLHGENLIAFKYVDTPNGSLEDIAGIINEKGNVLGLMPHPDRAFAKELGSDDGALVFQSLVG